MRSILRHIGRAGLALGLGCLLAPIASAGPEFYDNETLHSNQDPSVESRRSDHFRSVFGYYNRDTAVAMTESLAQGNLQMMEFAWNRWVNDMGFRDLNESSNSAYIDGKKYRANWVYLMTFNDGGGGGAYMSTDSHGFAWAMANTTYCRLDPPSTVHGHEFGHCWEGTSGGFNGSNSSGMWWEFTANWMSVQVFDIWSIPDALLYNATYYPAHGRDFYHGFPIWDVFKEDPRYGYAWVQRMWSSANASQRVNEFAIDRMVRLDTSGSPDHAGAIRDKWGEYASKMVTMDFERQFQYKRANKSETDWKWYRGCRAVLVKQPGAEGWYRISRQHAPMQYGFNIIPLSASAANTVSCNFQPVCDPVRQSDWRACLVAVTDNGDARYSSFWNKGTNSITLGSDENQLYLVVIATPKPMAGNSWDEYRKDSGSQFPYRVRFTNASPKHVVYVKPNVTGSYRTNPDGTPGGFVQSGASVASTAYVGPNAMVLNTAKVQNYARVEDYAVVRNTAQVRDNAIVSGHAVVQDSAQIYGNAKVRDWAVVGGNAQIYENAKVIEHGSVVDTGNVVCGCVVVKGTSSIYAPSTLSGSLITDGDTANGGTGTKGVHFGWAWGQEPSRFTGLTDNKYIYAQHTFEKDHPVWAWDEYGINHGYLMNGARAVKDTVAPTRGGRVLALDGVRQYVELHPSINDWKETAIALWVKWSGTKWDGTTDDQKIFSMGDGAAKSMYLTPMDSQSGSLKFVISNGVASQSLVGSDPLQPNVWTHVAIVFSGSVSTLYVNGAAVASNPLTTIFPDGLNAPLMENANYLGRDRTGNYFYGYIDDFRVYSKALGASDIAAIYAAPAPAAVSIPADTTAPTPNAASWLVTPEAISDSAITMSATPGTDASNWVEYYFDCTTEGGHDSGWVSFNKYTDVGLTPGTYYSYTVKMRDKDGNTTGNSAEAGATTQTASIVDPAFSYGPVGIANGQIKMATDKLTSPSGLVEYKFDRVGSNVTSGWRATPTWTDTGLTTGGTYAYTVQARDGRGNVSESSPAFTAVAKDMAAPKLVIPFAQWETPAYATIDNKISMTAMSTKPEIPDVHTDPSGVQYKFFCVSGGGPDSSWQSSAKFTTGTLPDGTYVYRYKIRDKSAQYNEWPEFSTPCTVTISPLRGYHNYNMSQLASLPDDYLVSFSGTVVQVESDSYVVRDIANGVSIRVRPSTNAAVTDWSLILKNVNVKGHLYTLGGSRIVTFATVTSTGNPTLNTVTGKVTNSSGDGIAGAVVYFSYTANASKTPVVTATTDANGNYAKGVIDGTWYVCAGAGAYNTSADKIVAVSGGSVGGVDFTLGANVTVSGKVTNKSDGSAVAGASVYFSTSPNASSSPMFTATTDANGNYSQSVQNGTWYVSASKTGFYTSADQAVVVNGVDVSNISIVIRSNVRNIPRPADLLFSAVTDTLPETGNTGNWATYLPAGKTLTAMGSPTVELINGKKYVKTLRTDSDGYDLGVYSSPIAVNGASIVTQIRPVRNSTYDDWNSCVDIFYNRLVIGIHNSTGRLTVWRNGSRATGPVIPNGQITILSMVVQPDGKYKVWANGTLAMEVTDTSNMTSLVPNVPGGYANHINIGRNNPDPWSAFNGNIGDVFVYKVALSDAERQQLENDLTGKFFGLSVSAAAGQGGSISPAGVVDVQYGDTLSFSIPANPGYVVSSVTVDGCEVGPVESYTFSDIAASHTISAQFAEAGAVGSIAELKAMPADSAVTLVGNEIVTYAPRDASGDRSTNFFYIGEKQGMGGLKVIDKTSDTFTIGNQVTHLTGYVRKPEGMEVYLELTSDVIGTGNTPIMALGMNSGSILTDTKVQTNAIRTWGKVKSINGTVSFVMDDNGRYGAVTVILNGAALPAGFDVSKTAVVSGVVTTDHTGKPVVYAQEVRAI